MRPISNDSRNKLTPQKKDFVSFSETKSNSMWALTDSNRRPSACKADALNQLS